MVLVQRCTRHLRVFNGVVILKMEKISELFSKKSSIIWHDLRLAPYDLPEENQQIITTIETVNGDRIVHTDIFIKYLDDSQYNYSWIIKYINSQGIVEDTIFWEEVIAWAELPIPYLIERDPI